MSSVVGNGKRHGPSRLAAVQSVALMLFTFSLFYQVGAFEFLNYDDRAYVTKNHYVRDGLTPRGIVWAFASTGEANWHPLTWLSHMTDVELFGLDPRGHHLVNALIHTLNALLLFRVLAAATGGPWRSLFAAVLFAIHPLRAESVAWVAERKDVLSGFFLMLLLAAYLRHVRSPRPARMVPVAVLLALGLMAKQTLVTLPVALLLLDFWPLSRLSSLPGRSGCVSVTHLLLEKAPLAVLALAASGAAFVAQGSSGAIWNYPLPGRVANAAVSGALYIGKTVLPIGLGAHYPYLGSTLTAWQVAGASLLLVALTALFAFVSRRRPFYGMGWAWYILMLLPVIGLVQIGTQGMADRYTYLPHIGLAVLVSWGLAEFAGIGSRFRAAAITLAVLAVAILYPIAWRQTGYWRNDLTLFFHAVEIAPDSHVAHNELGEALARAGRNREASAHFSRAFQLNPESRASAHFNAGTAAALRGNLKQARGEYQEALRLLPPHMTYQILTIRKSLATLDALESKPHRP